MFQHACGRWVTKKRERQSAFIETDREREKDPDLLLHGSLLVVNLIAIHSEQYNQKHAIAKEHS